jgi:hypothetical protein
MANKVVRNVVGELMEVGKSTVKGSQKAVRDITKQVVKTVINRPDAGETDEFVKDLYGKTEGSVSPEMKSNIDGEGGKQQIDKLSKLDSIKSQERYKQIQEEIRIETRKRKEQPAKYITGQTGFDEERIEDPESFMDKQEKKQEKFKDKKKEISLRAKKGMGTGEVRVGE